MCRITAFSSVPLLNCCPRSQVEWIWLWWFQEDYDEFQSNSNKWIFQVCKKPTLDLYKNTKNKLIHKKRHSHFTPNKHPESHPIVYGCHFTVFRGTIPAFLSERCGPCFWTFFNCPFALKLRWLHRQVSDGKAQLITNSAWKAAFVELTMEGRCQQCALLRVQHSTTYSKDSLVPVKAPALACCYIPPATCSFDRCTPMGIECSGKTISLDCTTIHFSLSR